VVCLENGHAVVSAAIADTVIELVVTTSELVYQTRNDPRLFGLVTRVRPEISLCQNHFRVAPRVGVYPMVFEPSRGSRMMSAWPACWEVSQVA
jgi:hypothetical protein